MLGKVAIPNYWDHHIVTLDVHINNMVVVGLLGPNPGSELISQKSPCTISPFGNDLWSAD